MMVIGITGGIGTGKTTAAEYLISKGFAHVDADQIGRELTADGQPILERIGSEFGCVSKSCDHGNRLVLNRKALADVVFRDKKKRELFDEIIHTEMKKVLDLQIAYFKERAKAGDPIRGILLDAPLLFEAEINDRCDVVILITADIDERIRRVVNRDDTDMESVRDRIDNQMSDEKKAQFSDFVIDNSGNPEEMFSEIDNILEHLGV